MRTRSGSKTLSRLVVMSSVGLLMAAVGFACTVDEENPATSRPRGTEAGSTQTTDEGGSAPPTGVALCGKYGDFEGVKTIANMIIAKAKADCRVTNRFDAADQHATECFQQWVGSNFLCPGIAFSVGTSADLKGKKCESRYPGVTLTNGEFSRFMVDVSDGLKEKTLTDDEITKMLPAFEGGRGDLTKNNQSNNYEDCATPCEVPDKQKCVTPNRDAGVNDAGPKDAATNDAGDGGDGG